MKIRRNKYFFMVVFIILYVTRQFNIKKSINYLQKIQYYPAKMLNFNYTFLKYNILLDLIYFILHLQCTLSVLHFNSIDYNKTT